MITVLLGAEILSACLLFAGMLTIVGVRRKTRTAAVVICGFGILVGWLPVGLLVSITGALRFVSRVWDSGFGSSIALAVGYVVGVTGLLFSATRRNGEGVRWAEGWPLGRVAASWAVIMALIVMTLWAGDRRALLEIQKVRGEAGALALSIAGPRVDDSANAALVYVRIGERLNANDIELDRRFDSLAENADLPETAAYLTRHQETLALVRTAADMPECRFDHETLDMNTRLPELAVMMKGAKLLAIAARAEAANGDAVLALADCRRIYCVARHAHATPLAISAMVGIRSDFDASMTAAKVLPSVTAKQQLDRFAVLDPQTLSRDLTRDFQGEEACALAAMSDLAEGRSPHPMPPDTGFANVGGPVVWRLWLQGDVARYRRYIKRLRGVVSQPYYQSAAECKAIRIEYEKMMGSILCRGAIAPMLLQYSRMVEAQALRSTVNVAVAATSYRLEHNEYPATPDLLIPGRLDAMPTDPFDGKPLRMKKLPDGSLVIYSIGVDGVDNGGDVEPKDDNHRPADVGFVLKMLNRR